jgi:tripartite-type tricarboxylate transporter receptor subunit TctC
MAEAGISDYEQTFRLALFAPAGTPASIVARLNREIGAGLTTGAVIDAFTAQGVETEHSTPEGLAEILVRDIGTYRQVASKARIARH